MRRYGFFAVALGTLVLVLGVGSYAVAGSGSSFSETLDGFQEVPAVSSAASGQFRAQVAPDGQSIDWVLSYTGTEGAVQQAHVHLAQRDVNGGITVFLCTNLGNGPAGTQPCPAAPAVISGSIRAADVSPNIPATAAARAQGLDTGEMAELVRALRAGVTYANVHSTKFPGGEIRAQLDNRFGSFGR